MTLKNQSRASIPTISRIALIVFMLLSVGCARTYQARYVETSHFLDDYSLLKNGANGDALLSFWKEGTNWAGYKKIIIDPVVISKLPDSGLNDMKHTENHRLKELFEYKMREALKKNFRLVAHSGPDTLRVQFAITDAESSILLLDLYSAVYPSARALSLLKMLATGTESYVGQASVEGKITDSQTGELLMASADCRAGGKTLIGAFDSLDDVEQAYQYWASQLNYQLCTKQGHSDCPEPE
ncbi:MAG: DUF3313 domain-containing protein [Methylobacter sp.]|jgi:hypothetical protein|nr:DUF3313 domain-containing protein [Methylobacter sp.]